MKTKKNVLLFILGLIVGGVAMYFLTMQNVFFVSHKIGFEKAFSQKIKTREAQGMVRYYNKKSIRQFKSKYEDSPGVIVTKPIKAFEIDNMVIKEIRDSTAIYALRIYLGRRISDDLYTLVIVPVGSDGKHLDYAYDWHGPCPPCDMAQTDDARRDALEYGK